MWEDRTHRARRRLARLRNRGAFALLSLKSRAAYALLVLAAALIGFAMAVSGPLAAGASASGPGSGGGGLTTPTSPTGTTPTGTTPIVTTPTATTTTPTTTTRTTSTPLTTTPGATPVPAPPTISPGTGADPFAKRGMWIWVLSDSDGGNLDSIIATADQLGIKTLTIKSADGPNLWPQFSPALVTTLHAAGLDVCAWQYVYGAHPIFEAEAAAKAVKDGADCLVIDAEVEYQGRYVQAQRYITKLRSLIGQNFPVALAGFPWIDYHPSFPYSIFLGPGGAQYNTPQMYWKDIGVSVKTVYSHTYAYNELYQRPIDPLGQLFQAPAASQIRMFRSVSRAYHAAGVSWWDWQDASAAQLAQTARPAGPVTGFVANTTVATLSRGAAGDVVVWAQEHLVSAGQAVTIDGEFGPQTQAAVERFQLSKGLPETGVIDPYTWAALLQYSPVAVKWVMNRKQLTAQVVASASSAAAGRRRPEVLAVPKSASLPERANELAGSPTGAGGHGPGTASR